MKRKRSGFTLVEVIVSMALIGMISVSLLGGFPSQLMNINKGTAITVQAFEEQSNFEDIIYNVKTMIKEHNPAASLDSLVSTVPEWSYETVQVLGQNIVMQKLNKSYDDVSKDNTIYLSRQLAEKEKVNKLSMTGVMIDVSTDVNNLVADLSLSPLPKLTAVHANNSSDPDFYVNLYRWWKSNPGKDLATLVFPDDFTMISISQTTNVLTDLLDNVGAGRFVALTVTPVDINGHRGNTMLSSNYVFIKGAEWRVGPFPWADMNNDYNYDENDVRIATDRIRESLNAASHTIPNFSSPTEMLSIRNSSLFVPMNIEPVGGLIPGDIPVQITGSEVLNWSFENNINIAKDFQVLNNSDVNITAGTGGNGGSIYLYPYIELNASGNPVMVGGFPNIINHGTSIATDGNINLKTLSRGDIELLNHNQLEGNNINLEARGGIQISNSTLTADNDIVLDTKKNPEITGDRSVKLQYSNFSSLNPNKSIRLETDGDILFKGGGWSSNQTLYIPNGRNILLTKGDAKVSNAGIIDVGNTGRIFFEHSMSEDVERSLRIRLEKESNNSFKLTTINYNRNVEYASPSANQKVIMSGLWTKLGNGNHNFEFTTRVLSGPGTIDDLEYSFLENGVIKINVTTTRRTTDTRIKIDIRDRYNNEVVGNGYFVYSVDNSGNSTIDVEAPPPLNYYTITFNTYGGSPIAPIGGFAGDSVGTVADPTRIGYEFLGWDKTVPAVIPDYDLELNAIWKAIEYKITFDTKGGSAISDKYYHYGDEIHITNPTKRGYSFNGWSPAMPDTMPANDLHLVAEWTNKTLIVEFESNGGTAVYPATKTVTFDLEYGTLPIPTRTGFNFIGWYTDSTNGTKVEHKTIVQDPDNHKLYAHWEVDHQVLKLLQINPTDERNRFALRFNNRISSIDDSKIASKASLSIADDTVNYSYSTSLLDWGTSTGDYYVTVRDVYNQTLKVNLKLTSSGIFFTTYHWTATTN